MAEPMGSCSLVLFLWVCGLEDGAAAVGGNGGVLCAGDSDFVAFKRPDGRSRAAELRSKIKDQSSKFKVFDGGWCGAGCWSAVVL